MTFETKRKIEIAVIIVGAISAFLVPFLVMGAGGM